MNPFFPCYLPGANCCNLKLILLENGEALAWFASEPKSYSSNPVYFTNLDFQKHC